MDMDWIKNGATAWATTGTYGWRPCIILSADRIKGVKVRFESGSRSHGLRGRACLVPRDPALRGADKPTPEDAWAAQVAALLSKAPQNV
jgi:hypothetical protein